MSALTLRKATREKTKIRVALVGPSGSGKTYSALVLASGLTSWDKVALIDTENGSGDLYSHLGAYNVIRLSPPFSPERYVEAIQACEAAGMEVIIIDSMSHEWEGKGGILEIKDAMTGNSFTAWGKLTPRHNRFIETILHSKCHVIGTMRAKQDYVLTEKNGRQVPEKIGLKAITRDGVDYEFTLVFDLNLSHLAIASKDRTGIFMDAAVEVTLPEKITKETGTKILDWTRKGVEPPAVEPEKPVAAPQEPQPSPLTNILKAMNDAGDKGDKLKLLGAYDSAFQHPVTPDDVEKLNHCLKAVVIRISGKSAHDVAAMFDMDPMTGKMTVKPVEKPAEPPHETPPAPQEEKPRKLRKDGGRKDAPTLMQVTEDEVAAAEDAGMKAM